MADSRTLLGATLAPLGDPLAGLGWLARNGFRAAQLSATHDGVRPRDLDASARRGFRAHLGRLELDVSGIDLWIPATHFADPAHVDRAVSATEEAILLAAALDRVPICMNLPGPTLENAQALDRIAKVADREGVAIADFTISPSAISDVVAPAPAARPSQWIGVDPAAVLASGGDPVAAVALAGARLRAVRVVDLLNTGLRGPIMDPDGRLDVLAFKAALSVAGDNLIPVADARQWSDPRAGLLITLERWASAGRAPPG